MCDEGRDAQNKFFLDPTFYLGFSAFLLGLFHLFEPQDPDDSHFFEMAKVFFFSTTVGLMIVVSIQLVLLWHRSKDR